ncbi:CoA-transferase family III [Ascodesmis nigricans]|uniref:CoA-transferase family III n=1 Tax=Ascodesmis nigricans TaxID=341454 RepID=A0A4V3SHR6_9PEZI|nr:CoA-transferase family III [Ascodesmis nigricans]
MTSSPPLTGTRVIEFAGLAPGPFAGKLLADYGAHVLRIDRHDISTKAPTSDSLAEFKRSIRVNLKSPAGVALIKKLALTADVLIDPYRPGVLEKLGLGPEILCALNPRLIFARMAGFRRDGKYKDMAGHDINYIAVSGALSMLGRKGEKPYAPGNFLADFAGGGMMCATGILLALVAREKSGKGQVVEANMVDGSAYISAWPRYMINRDIPMWTGERGVNTLDGGAPFYDTYETKDGGYMAVGPLEPQFYKVFIEKLFPGQTDIPDRMDPDNWLKLREMYTAKFLEKTRKEWEDIYDGTDACVTPVKTVVELQKEKFEQRAPVTLRDTPAIKGKDWVGLYMVPGTKGKEALEEWWGLKEGEEWTAGKEGFAVKAKL